MFNTAARSILLTTISALALVAPAMAQQSQVPAAPPAPPAAAPPAVTPAEEATGQDAIIVTGTRRTDRTLADSPVPVDVISA
ncbi:MAG TPA: hypothetical protein VGR05_08075, partial [Sphingomicrobium sp.]|nr:hypothetical protein [Sphingomicrobium sp.]